MYTQHFDTLFFALERLILPFLAFSSENILCDATYSLSPHSLSRVFIYLSVFNMNACMLNNMYMKSRISEYSKRENVVFFVVVSFWFGLSSPGPNLSQPLQHIPYG